MDKLELSSSRARHRFGVKGPGAVPWLQTQGLPVPQKPNTWLHSMDSNRNGGEVFVARLGSAEFFLEDGAMGNMLENIVPSTRELPSDVYPVLREDSAFVLSGTGSRDVLAQVCAVNFAGFALETHPVVMTLMVGVAVTVVPQQTHTAPRYRIWCDPTFGSYLISSLTMVVTNCGGIYTGVSA